MKIEIGPKILGEDAPEDPAMEMKMLRVALTISNKRLTAVRSIIAANQYGFSDKEALSLIFFVEATAEINKLDSVVKRMQVIIDKGVAKANKRL